MPVFPDKNELEKLGGNVIDFMNQDIITYWNIYMAPFLEHYFKEHIESDDFSDEDGLSVWQSKLVGDYEVW